MAEGVALTLLAWIEWDLGRCEGAEACFEAARSIAREVGSRRSEAISLDKMGLLATTCGQHEIALSRFEAALAIHRQLENRRSVGMVWGHLGMLHRFCGRRERAEACFEAALAIHRDLGHGTDEAAILDYTASLRLAWGELDDAHALFDAAIALFEANGRDLRAAKARGRCGIGLRLRGQIDEAQRHFEASLATQRAPDPASEVEMLEQVGLVHLDRSELPEASEALERALALSERTGDLRSEGILAGLLGICKHRQNEHDAAAPLLESADALLREYGDPLALGAFLARRSCTVGASDPDAAAWLREAARLAERTGVGPRSELAVLIGYAEEALRKQQVR